jgi:hypothetical protein
MLIFKILLIISFPLLLEFAAIRIIISKVKANRRFIETSEEMNAVVTSKGSEKIRATNARYTRYLFSVDADNGNSYEICARGLRASLTDVGDTVKILVPEGAPPTLPKNEKFEYIIHNAKETLSTLSVEDRQEFNEYLSRQINHSSERAEYLLSGKRETVFAYQGSGLVSEIIGFIILAVLLAGFIVYVINFIITEVMI